MNHADESPRGDDSVLDNNSVYPQIRFISLWTTRKLRLESGASGIGQKIATRTSVALHSPMSTLLSHCEALPFSKFEQ